MSMIHSQYLEAEILSADPVKLTALLYRGALDAVTSARRHLANEEIRERSRRITQAYEILFELSSVLDHKAGGEISRNLGELYAYMQVRLLDANARQVDQPLAEIEQLLTSISEAWSAVPSAPTHSSVSEEEYSPVSFTG